MCCLHRFLDYHKEGLFPSWKVRFLFIGTFNPSWNRPGENADYFYGRITSNYMWFLLSRFFKEDGLEDRSVAEKIAFCKRNLVGFTDLIKGVRNADHNNPAHKERILSFKDADLLKFGDGLEFNIDNITRYIDENQSIQRVYFTLRGENVGAISTAIKKIEQHCQKIGAPTTHRLHTPSGMGLGEGKPQENVITHRWHQQGMDLVNPGFDLTDFPIK
jgi:hypothetical protein